MWQGDHVAECRALGSGLPGARAVRGYRVSGRWVRDGEERVDVVWNMRYEICYTLRTTRGVSTSGQSKSETAGGDVDVASVEAARQ